MKKKLRSFLANSILTSILLILLGATFIIFSDKVDEALNLIFFSALLILGGGQFIFYLRSDRKTAADTTDLVNGLFLVLVAFFVYFRWNDNVSILTQYLLALLIAFNSIRLLQSSISLHSLKEDKWYLMLLFAILGTGYGSTLLFLSFESDTLLYRLLGIGFVYSGVLSIISSIWVSVRLRQKILEDKLAEKGGKKKDYPVTDLDTVN